MNQLDELTRDHLQLADENYEFAERFRMISPQPLRWVAVVAFYAAVHYLSAYFWEKQGIEVSSHRQRGRLMRSVEPLETIRTNYERLYFRSLEARYRPRATFSNADVQTLVERDLELIYEYVTDALGDEGGTRN